MLRTSCRALISASAAAVTGAMNRPRVEIDRGYAARNITAIHSLLIAERQT
jgi:hypothetical protein